MKDLQVLHVNAGNLYGGVETFLTTLAQERHLCESMKPQFALCFEGRLSKNLRSLDCSVHNLGEVRTRLPWTVWQARWQLGQLLLREKFDVVICHSCWAQAIFGPVVKKAGLALVLFCHDVPQGTHWLERWAQRTRPTLVLANSQYTQAALPCLYPKIESRVFYLPVVPPSLGLGLNRADLQTSEQAVVIVQVSRLEPWKGQSLLLEALQELKHLPTWVCWIVGGDQRPQETAYLQDLKTQAIAAGIAERVKFLGQRSDVAAVLAAADIFCQPNIGPEPFGIVFIEALYAGLPVVTTAIGGGAEIFGDSHPAGEASPGGRLVPPADAQALAAVLQELILSSEVRQNLAQGGRSHAQALCDPQQQLLQLYLFLSEAKKMANTQER
jgi:glycosyltransferase involved in cell wall biosynthesis